MVQKLRSRINLTGTTRITILIGNFAVKIPNIRSYRLFLCGLLNNLSESLLSRHNNLYEEYGLQLCPVIFSLPGGFMNIMPRAEVCTNIPHVARYQDLPDCIERKPDSFGYVKNKLMVIDYG